MSTLLTFLVEQPKQILDQLYSNNWTCQSIFRTLPPLAKQYILRLLFLDTPLRISRVRKWLISTDKKAEDAHLLALTRLQELKICSIEKLPSLTSSNAEKSGRYFVLNHTFKQHMIEGLSNTASSPFVSVARPDKSPPTVKQLEIFSRKSWEIILRFMLGILNKSHPSETIIRIILSTKLMENISDGREIRITDFGYQFLLKNSHQQVWILLQAYLSAHRNLPELLNFLFQLSFLTFGKDYAMSSLTDSQKEFVDLLMELGLIFKPKSKSRRFYPTELAINLATGQEPKKKAGFLIVETNFRLYSYSRSTLTISILRLFADMHTFRAACLPNLVVGVINRQCILEAFRRGITAAQIIEYLESNAHEQARKEVFPVPETLADQIRLWEQETNVVEFQPGILYSFFPTKKAYLSTKKYAEDLGIFLWGSEANSFLIVKAGNEPAMESFFASSC